MAQREETRPRSEEPRQQGSPGQAHPHPGPKEYIRIAVILAVVTAAEVGLYYMNLPHGLLIPFLLFFSIIKFALVALYFMHLKYDLRILRRLFVTGLVLALIVYAIALTTLFALR